MLKDEYSSLPSSDSAHLPYIPSSHFGIAFSPWLQREEQKYILSKWLHFGLGWKQEGTLWSKGFYLPTRLLPHTSIYFYSFFSSF